MIDVVMNDDESNNLHKKLSKIKTVLHPMSEFNTQKNFDQCPKRNISVSDQIPQSKVLGGSLHSSMGPFNR